jgi:leader peptidase (prepilin peptidase)/N-methyltransferase
MLVELIMGILFSLVMIFKNNFIENMLFMLVVFAIVTLSFVDLKTFEIPIELNYFILGIGIIYTVINYKVFYEHIIGAIVVSGFIAILIYATNGRAMGGGDCKLMFTCGLVLGWKLIIVAFMIGCILGSIIHIARIKISKEDKVLAFGPYLAAGIYIAYVWGDSLLNMYMSLY